MKVLLCGATGFIGTNIYHRLKDKVDLTVVQHTRPAPAGAKVVVGDLTLEKDCERILSAGYDVVLQFAASTTNISDVVNAPWIHVTKNAVMNSWICQYAHIFGVKHLVFPSCTTMYPSSQDYTSEKDFDRNKIHPKYFGVASTKVYIEDVCRFWANQGKTKYTVMRHSNIYGPYDRFNLKTGHVCSATIRKIIDATDTLQVWGAGTEIRDLLYVDDLIDFIEIALEKQKTPYELYNVGLGKGVTVNELVDTLIAISGKELTLEHIQAPTIDFDMVLDCTKASFLGWSPKTSLIGGLIRTYNWALKNGTK